MFWLFLCTAISYQYIEITSAYLLQNISVTPDDEVRLSYPAVAAQTMYWMVFYDLSNEDTLKYTPRHNYTNPWDDPYWITATPENLADIFHLGIPMTFAFRVGSSKEVHCRGGYTPRRNCDSGTFVTSRTEFSMEDFMDEYNLDSAEHFCVIFVHKTGSFTQEVEYDNRYDVTSRDVHSGLRVANTFYPMYTSECGYTSVFLIFNLTSSNPISSFDFTFSDVTTIGGTHTYCDLDDINNLPRTPEPTPARSPEPTPEPSPKPTPEPSPEPTPEQTQTPNPPTENPTHQTETPTPEPPTENPTPQTPTENPTPNPPSENPNPQTETPTPQIETPTPQTETPTPQTETPTHIPGVPDPTTPIPTWDGQWAEEPNIIVRGNDIPEIVETHPPIQTDYVKTDVPKVQTVVTISTGSVIVGIVVVLTVINIVRSYKKVKDIVHDHSNSDVEDFSFTSSYTIDSISDENNRSPFVLPE